MEIIEALFGLFVFFCLLAYWTFLGRISRDVSRIREIAESSEHGHGKP